LAAALCRIRRFVATLQSLREPEKSMRKFLLWDHDGVLVDTERWFFVATQECLRELGVELDHATYLQYMAAGHSCWELALEQGQSTVVIAAKRRERDRRYQSYLATRDITIDGVLGGCPKKSQFISR
jgi:beta-phosphoglucomutase-like phosphatase (HAD superfamily)